LRLATSRSTPSELIANNDLVAVAAPGARGRSGRLIQSPASYFAQDLALIKIQKIVKCETTTNGA
jgi:hypothetical protein